MKTDLSAHIAEIARRVLGPENKARSNRAELRFGNHGSLSVVIATGEWFDHENDIGGGLLELIRVKAGVAADRVHEWLQREFGIEFEEPKKATASSKRIVATYDYRDERGTLLFQVVRLEPKDFRQRRPDGKRGRVWSTKGVRPVPYRLPELIGAPPEAPVFIVEGEKDVDRLNAEGLIATCNAGGAAKSQKTTKPGGSAKWRPELNEFFRGRDVVVLPDNDDAGRDHAQAVAANVAPVAKRLRIVELPGLPPKDDISDWPEAGGTIEQLHAIVAEAKPFAAEAPVKDPGSDDAEIARLAALSRLQYERERTTAARRLDCRPPILDRLVAAARGGAKANGVGQGRVLELHEPEPWPDAVDGATLLGAISIEIRRYVVMGDHEADAVALWSVAAHGFDGFYIFPRLFVKAPEKQCGKTTLLDVIGCLVSRKLSTESITPAATYRTIEAYRPTLLLDEVDTFLKDNEEMRGVIDSGHKRDGAVVRVVGDNNEPRCFSTWCPMVLAGIGNLPGTIEDRSISIGLQRRRLDEPVESFRADRPNGLARLARMAARWVSDTAAALADADPPMPAGVINRSADNWRPLLAVADLAGGDWPRRARAAAAEMIGGNEDESRRPLALADIRVAFEVKQTDRLASEDLVEFMASLEDRPWAEYRRDKPISKAQLARLLKPLKISSGSVRLPDGRTPKGYHRSQFEDAFARYLPSQNATTPQPAENLASQPDSKTPQVNGCGVLEFPGSASNPAACGGVAFSEPLFWANDALEREERAAILEYDAGLPRDEAERAAGLEKS
jgi:Protein of unknown function (DUF3631)